MNGFSLMSIIVYGLDFGFYDINVYDKKKDTIWKEKNVIAF